MKNLFYCISLLFLSVSLQGQDDLHTKKKKAIDDYKRAKDLLALSQYNDAEGLLFSAIKRDDSFDEAILLLSQLYLQKGMVTNASNLISSSHHELDEGHRGRAYYDIAYYYWQNGQYQQAKTSSSHVTEEVIGKSGDQIELLLSSIDFALEESWEGAKENQELLKSELNQFDMQYFPSIDASGQMVFTARDKQWGGDEQIMISTDSSGYWSKPEIISNRINTERNEGTAAISADGLTLVYTGCNRSQGFGSCDLYISKKSNGQWTKPELLPEEINSRFWESQPSLSSRGDALYFTSTRPGYGGQDIWVAYYRDGQWEQAMNLGSQINSSSDDASPYIYPDDKTLFFSSKGRVGMGGFDIFQSKRATHDWARPINLGGAINDHQDQVGYSISEEAWAYYSSANENGEVFLIRSKIPQVYIPEIQNKEFLVEVIDSITGLPIEAKVFAIIEDTEYLLSKLKPGLYSYAVDQLPESIMVTASGYRSYESSQLTYSNQAYLMRRDDQACCSFLYFDSNQYELSLDQKDALHQTVDIFQSDPNRLIVLEGFTDSVGDRADNYRLAQRRVNAVKNELIQFGVDSSRIESLFLGESLALQQLGDNRDEAQYRRVKISIKNDF